MKRIYRIALNILATLLSLACLFSCSPTGGKGDDEKRGEKLEFTEGDFRMIGNITDLGEKISVDVTEAEYASGIHWVIISESTAIVDSEGYELERDDLKVGDKVEITYNGQVMMSLPPQIAAISIRVLK